MNAFQEQVRALTPGDSIELAPGYSIVNGREGYALYAPSAVVTGSTERLGAIRDADTAADRLIELHANGATVDLTVEDDGFAYPVVLA